MILRFVLVVSHFDDFAVIPIMGLAGLIWFRFSTVQGVGGN